MGRPSTVADLIAIFTSRECVDFQTKMRGLITLSGDLISGKAEAESDHVDAFLLGQK